MKNNQVTRHMEDLKALGYKYNSLRPLQTLENKANRMATDECNGVKEYTEDEWNNIEIKVLDCFQAYLPGFFINRDPRGYALKLETGRNNQEEVIRYQDWGKYQILCPEFK